MDETVTHDEPEIVADETKPVEEELAAFGIVKSTTSGRIRLQLKPDFRTPEAMAKIKAQLETNPQVQEVFRKLARAEKEHSKTLQEKWKYLQPVVNKRAPINEEVNSFIQNEVKGRVFPNTESYLEKLPELETDLCAIEFGIACEKRSIEILEHLQDNERKIDVKAIFSHLIAEEKKHLAALEVLKADLEG